ADAGSRAAVLQRDEPLQSARRDSRGWNAALPGVHQQLRYDRRRLYADQVVGAKAYRPTTSTTNDPGLMVRRGPLDASPAGVSTYSAAVRKIFFVAGSKAIVLALGCVFTTLASPYSSADCSWIIWSVPSPQEKKTNRESGSNAAKSTPA